MLRRGAEQRKRRERHRGDECAPEAHLDVYGVFQTNGFALDTDILAALNTIAQTGPARDVRAVK